MKVRVIASTLLPNPNSGAGGEEGVDDASGGGGGGAAPAGQGIMMGYLRSFLDILTGLEKGRAPPGSVPGAGDVNEGGWGDERDDEEDVDMGRWAGLREYQRQFADNETL